MSKKEEAIAVYTAMEQKLSEDEFKALAERAKEENWLGDLYEQVEGRVNTYRAAKENYTVTEQPDKAEEQQELLRHVERQLAIVQYLHFANEAPE